MPATTRAISVSKPREKERGWVAPSMSGDAREGPMRRASAHRRGRKRMRGNNLNAPERKRRPPRLKTIGEPRRLSSSNIGPSRAHRLTAKPLFRYSKITDGRGQPELSDQQDLGRLLAQIPGCRLLAPRRGRRGRNSPRTQSNPGRTGQSEGRRTSRTARQDGGLRHARRGGGMKAQPSHKLPRPLSPAVRLS